MLKVSHWKSDSTLVSLPESSDYSLLSYELQEVSKFHFARKWEIVLKGDERDLEESSCQLPVALLEMIVLHLPSPSHCSSLQSLNNYTKVLAEHANCIAIKNCDPKADLML
ncbi:CBM_HP2_G0009900.mRNA.1.CDS.1 [Saccharomyces cerevisiae]|nr:CBM_HP2_G0009900.mRNA.1.CDS.1 [Saccharomyces cerevisiae]CAI6420681.1 CBM_HP2_G0009900.mRNA.1.CDS.1 [Saccharomyces cerevisiae]